MKTSFLIVCVIALFSCSEPSKPLALNISSNTPAETKQLIESNWSKVRTACVGLDKYSDALQFVKVEDNFSYAPPHAQRAWAEYIIKENQSMTPAYMLSGNHCLFEVSRDGKTLSISKGVCKSLCMDKDLRSTDGDLKTNLN